MKPNTDVFVVFKTKRKSKCQFSGNIECACFFISEILWWTFRHIKLQSIFYIVKTSAKISFSKQFTKNFPPRTLFFKQTYQYNTLFINNSTWTASILTRLLSLCYFFSLQLKAFQLQTLHPLVEQEVYHQQLAMALTYKCTSTFMSWVVLPAYAIGA